MYICLYMYNYIDREREIHINIYIYIYTHIYTHVYISIALSSYMPLLARLRKSGTAASKPWGSEAMGHLVIICSILCYTE